MHPYATKAEDDGSGRISAATGRPKMTPVEAARHAALVRWKKANPLAARMSAARDQARANLRTKAAKQAAKKGKKAGGKGRAAAKPKAGTTKEPKLSPEGRAAQRAKVKQAQAEARVIGRQIREKARAERAAEREKARAAKPKAGGGGAAKPKAPAKDKPAKLTAEQRAGNKEAQRQQNVANVGSALDKADNEMLNGNGLSILAAARNGVEPQPRHADQLIKKGLAERGDDGRFRLTASARGVLRAADKGDVNGVLDALSVAGDKVNERTRKAGEKQARATERAKRAKERTDARNARYKKQDTQDADKQAGSKDEQDKRVAAEVARIAAARARKSMEDLTPIVDELTAIVGELTEVSDDSAAEIKAGRRNSTSDQATIDQIYSLAEQLCELAETLGATVEEDEPETDDEAEAETEGGDVELLEGKAVEFASNDLAVFDGDGCKAMAGTDGWVGGYLIKFGGDGDLSNWRDVFTKDTAYGRHTKSDVWVHHRMLPGLGKRRLTNQADIGMDDEGVFIKHLLDLRSSYERKLYDMAQGGKLGWSSGTAPHLVERKAQDDGSHVILEWPLGLDASYTPMPAGGLGVEARASAMKSLLADAGIDLLNAIYDNPEVDETDEGDRHDGAKALADRQQRLLLELELLTLESNQ